MSQTLKINFKELPKSQVPVLSYCRQLIKEGHPSDTRLEVYRDLRPDDPDMIIHDIGKAAKLTVREGGKKGRTTFVPFREKDYTEDAI